MPRGFARLVWWDGAACKSLRRRLPAFDSQQGTGDRRWRRQRQGMQEARDEKVKKQQRENRRRANRGRGQDTKQRQRIGEPRRSFIFIHLQPPIARHPAAPYVMIKHNSSTSARNNWEPTTAHLEASLQLEPVWASHGYPEGIPRVSHRRPVRDQFLRLQPVWASHGYPEGILRVCHRHPVGDCLFKIEFR